MSASIAAPRRPLFAFPVRVNEPSVRLVAAGVASGIVLGGLLRFPWVLPILALGFALRVAAGPRLSLLARAANWAVVRLGLEPRPIAGAPKQFAAAIGATLLATASVLVFAGLPIAGWAVAAMVAAFATLEAAFAFCLGCKIYAALFGCADCVVPQAKAAPDCLG